MNASEESCIYIEGTVDYNKRMGMKRFLKAIAVALCAAVCGSILLFSACAPEKPPEEETEPPAYTLMPALAVESGEVRNDAGERVTLRGVNAGGLFVTEHWMTGFQYGKTPSNDYRSLTLTFLERFGEEKTKRLWETYRENWWTAADFQRCADMGMNVIRLPFTYMNIDFPAIEDLDAAGQEYDFSAIEAFVNEAAEYGLYTILDLHGAYGSQNGQDHSGQIFETADEVTFYSNEQLMSLTVKLWEQLALHFKDNPAVAGYDILNEPGEKAGQTSERHWAFFDRVYEAIRGTGDQHIIIFESCWDGRNLPQPDEYGWENCMYSFHHYAGDSIGYDSYCRSWDNKLRDAESQNFGVPLYMGEFTNYESPERWDYVLDLLNTSGWHWTSWTYKVWGNMAWGVVNVPNVAENKVDASSDSYEEILEKFSHLQTENCTEHTFEDSSTLEDIFKQHLRSADLPQAGAAD